MVKHGVRNGSQRNSRLVMPSNDCVAVNVPDAVSFHLCEVNGEVHRFQNKTTEKWIRPKEQSTI